MNILIATMTLKPYSAVSNDVEAMYKALTDECAAPRCNCKIYAERRLSRDIEYITDKDFKKLLNDKDSLIIFHHSVYWEEGERFLKKAKGRIVFRYHNITPPEFFEKYSDSYTSACFWGREQTKRLINDYPDALWLCASTYNASDLKGVPAENISVCPPFNKTEEWTKTTPNQAVIAQCLASRDNLARNPLNFPSTPVNLLFVGRVAPNKGHLFLIDILNAYVKNFDSNIKLRIIGDLDESLEGYTQEIRHRIKAFGLDNNVEFIGEVDDSKLLAYYTGSDFFICASEHEGFLVPAAEAQYLKLPIIARAKAAVPDTVGADQILLGDDPVDYAAAIHTLHANEDYRDFLVAAGTKNFEERFSGCKITETFLNYLKQSGLVK